MCSTISRCAVFNIVVVLAVFLAGCHPKYEGKYVGAANMVTIELKSGKATVSDSSGGAPEVDDYTVNGDKITIKSKNGDIDLTIMQDGTLAAPFPIGSLKKAAD